MCSAQAECFLLTRIQQRYSVWMAKTTMSRLSALSARQLPGSSGSARQSSNGTWKQHKWRGRQSRQADVIEPCHRLPSSVARLEMAAHQCSNTLGNIDLPFPPLGLRRGAGGGGDGGVVEQTVRQRSRLSCFPGLGEEQTLYSSNRKQPSLKPAKYQKKTLLMMHVHV